MASGWHPQWLDQVLFNLQGLDPAVFTDWEWVFVESLAVQYANWRNSTSRMRFPTLKQEVALQRVHKTRCPEQYKNLSSFQHFPEIPSETP